MKDVYIKKEDLDSWISKYFIQDLISVDDLVSIIEDLSSELRIATDKIQELENDIEENYRRIPVSEQVGISDRNFI